jgi:hypothetical protein
MACEEVVQTYRARYDDFVISLVQTAALREYSEMAGDFWRGLQETALSDWDDEYGSPPYRDEDEWLAHLEEAQHYEERVASGPEHTIGVRDPHSGPLPALTRIIRSGHSIPSFRRAVLAQQLIMIFAHLDSFIADSVRVICEALPDVLKSRDRKMEWECIIDCGSWEELLEHLIEEYVARSDRGPILKRIDKMKDAFRLDLRLDHRALGTLEVAERVRHAFVHSGGRADSTFLDRCRVDNVAPGTSINLQSATLDDVHRSALLTGAAIYRSVCTKFLGITDHEVLCPFSFLDMTPPERVLELDLPSGEAAP